MGVFDPMVDVGVDGGGAAAGVDAGGVLGFDLAALGGGGSAAGDPVAERLAGVGVVDGVAPLAAGLGFGDLAGEVGDHRPVAGQLAGVVVGSGEGFQVDMEVDDPLLFAGSVADQQVEIDIGALGSLALGSRRRRRCRDSFVRAYVAFSPL